jgi:hypothetical protein
MTVFFHSTIPNFHPEIAHLSRGLQAPEPSSSDSPSLF